MRGAELLATPLLRCMKDPALRDRGANGTGQPAGPSIGGNFRPSLPSAVAVLDTVYVNALFSCNSAIVKNLSKWFAPGAPICGDALPGEPLM